MKDLCFALSHQESEEYEQQVKCLKDKVKDLKQKIFHDWEGISLPLKTTQEIGTSSPLFRKALRMISSSNIDYSLNNTDFELKVARSTELDQSAFERFARMDQHTSNDVVKD